jgi:hypothetical protein
MNHYEAAGFGVVLLLACVLWIYAYIRRRSKKRF